jgi:hypothetical protein
MKFKVAAERMFLRHGIILFAIAETDSDSKRSAQNSEPSRDSPFINSNSGIRGPRAIRMNPGNYVLKGLELAYVIAKDAFTAETVAQRGDWMFEPNKKGELEWENNWELKPVEGVEEEENGIGALLKKGVTKMKGAMNWAMNNSSNSLAGSSSTTSATVNGSVAEGSVTYATPTPIIVSGATPTTSTSLPKIETFKLPPPIEKLSIEANQTKPTISSVTNNATTTPTATGLSLATSEGAPPTAGSESQDIISPFSEDSDIPAGRNELVYMGEKGKGIIADTDSVNPEMALAPQPARLLESDFTRKTLVHEPLSLLKSPNPFKFKNVFKPFLASSSKNGKDGQPSAAPKPFTSDPPAASSLFSPISPNSDPTILPPSDLLFDHFLICSLSTDKFPSNLAFLIAPVRQKSPEMLIIVLSPKEPERDELDRIAAYGDVWYVKGSPLVRSDLKRCGVENAKKAVVLANPTQSK